MPLRPARRLAAALALLFLSHSSADEFTVTFDAGAPLGLSLDASLRVAGFARGAAGGKLPAEASGWLRRGDVLEAVNGERVRGRALADVTALVARAPAPRALAFSAPGSRAAEMAAVLDGPRGIHGHEGELQLAAASGGAALGAVPFLQAAFGGQLSCAAAPLALAEPATGCGAYRGGAAAAAARGAAIVVERGGCAFSDKAALAQAAGAVALVVLNNGGNSFVRMPIDDAEAARLDLTLAVVMVDEGPGADAIRELLGAGAAGGARAGAGAGAGAARRAGAGAGAGAGAAAATPAPPRATPPPGGVAARLVPRGLACAPWRAAAPPASARAADSDATDARAGAIFVFPPFTPLGGARARAHAASPGGLRGGGAHAAHDEPWLRGDGDSDGSGGGAAHVHSAAGGDARAALPFGAHERAGFAAADRAARALAGGSRAARALADAAAAAAAAAAPGAAEASVAAASGDADGAAEDDAAFTASSGATARAEYVRAAFGGAPPAGRLRLLRADPVDACAPLTAGSRAAGAALLVARGGCSFIEKARAVAAANASLMILASDGAAATAMGGDVGGDAGGGGAAPAVMVTRAAGAALGAAIDAAAAARAAPGAAAAAARALAAHPHGRLDADAAATHPELSADASVSLAPSAAVAAAWGELGELLDAGAWPAAAAARRKAYTRLARVHHPDRAGGSDERFALLAFLLRRANHFYDAASEPDFDEAALNVPLHA
jgi:hypothetical protein